MTKQIQVDIQTDLSHDCRYFSLCCDLCPHFLIRVLWAETSKYESYQGISHSSIGLEKRRYPENIFFIFLFHHENMRCF